MSETATYTPQTNLGSELQDIVAILKANGLGQEEISAALLGRCGVCASSWKANNLKVTE